MKYRKQLRAWNRLTSDQRDALDELARRREIANRPPCPFCNGDTYSFAGEYRCRAQCWRVSPTVVLEGVVWP